MGIIITVMNDLRTRLIKLVWWVVMNVAWINDLA